MSTEQLRSQFQQEIKVICEDADIKDHKAFPIWVCKNILGIQDESVIDEAVAIDGAHDYGIDIFYLDDDTDEAESYVWIVQVKFSNTLNHTVNREEALSFRETVKYLENCPENANSIFKQKSMAFRSAKQDNPRLKIIMLFAVTGKLNDHAKQIIQSEHDDISPDKSIQVLDLAEILSHLRMRHTPNIKINFDGNVINRIDSTTAKKSVIGYVDAAALIKSIKPYKRTIYLENPREYLGKDTSTNKEIIKTICDKDKKEKFWKLNNGITAICDGFDASEDSNTFTIKNFKVVNGRQTTSTLEQSATPIDGMFISLTIHEAVDSDEHNLISQATNTQNPIKPIDLITNSNELLDLESQCKKHRRDFYFEQQTNRFASEDSRIQYKITSRRLLEKNKTSRAYYAYAINPYEAMMPNRDLFSLVNPTHYNKIFRNRTIDELIIPHIFMTTLDALCSNWRKISSDPNSDDGDTYQKNAEIFSKRITKYFILKFINLSMMDIEENERADIEKKIIEIFQKLKKSDPIPDLLLNIVDTTCESFMLWFDSRPQETWPTKLYEKIHSPEYKESENDVPTPYDIMYKLKKHGSDILSVLKNERIRRIKIDRQDKIKSEILKIKDLR